MEINFNLDSLFSCKLNDGAADNGSSKQYVDNLALMLTQNQNIDRVQNEWPSNGNTRAKGNTMGVHWN